MLKYQPEPRARMLEKVLKSALANAEDRRATNLGELFVSDVRDRRGSDDEADDAPVAWHGNGDLETVFTHSGMRWNSFMGQKVNPTGFRTGIMVGWKSRWYASKQEFSQLLVEDHKIRNFIKKRQDKFGKPLYPAIAKIEIERTRDEVKVILFPPGPAC